MKALSLTQPWATLVVLGEKKIETRGWKTNHRGVIAIHAAQNFPKAARDFARTNSFVKEVLNPNWYDISDQLPLGAIIGTVRYGWEAGELEELLNSSDAFARDHSISRIAVGGVIYCLECDCWHASAVSYIQFFAEYKHEIAVYFKLEKQRKQQIARAQPLLET